MSLKLGLQGMYHFTGNVNDDSGNGYTLTNNGATLTTDKNGVSNQAYSFNGSSQNMTTTGANLVSPGTSSFTVSCWVYVNSISTASRILQMRNIGNTGSFWELQTYTDSKLYFNVYDGTNTTQVGSVGALSSTTWYHCIMEVDRETTKVRFYLNGIIKQETALTATGNLSNTLLGIGSTAQSTGFFGGKIDELRYYNRILTQYEKNQLYYGYDTTKNQVGILRKGLVNEFHFSGNTTDTGSAGSTLTNNGATLTTDKNSVSNQAYSFNGSSNYMQFGTPSVSFNSDFTFSCWFKTNTTASNQVLFTSNDGTPYLTVLIYTNSFFRLGLDMYDGTNNPNASGATTITTGTWYHACCVWDSVNKRITAYLQGVANATTTYSTLNTLTSATWQIGRRNSASYFNGVMDEIKIYNRALSDTEVKMLYYGYDTTATSYETLTGNLTAKYSYTGNTNDTSGNGYNLTNNSCTLTTDKNSISNQAYAFSGSAQYMNTATDLLANKTAITMTGWAKSSVWTTAPGGGIWLKNGASSTNDTGFVFSATTAYAIIRTASSNYGQYSFSLTNNNWYFFAMTFNGNMTTNATRLQMFIDKLYRTMTYTGTIPAATSSTSAASTIGRWEQQTTYFNGSIDEVRLYDTWLTQDELLELNYSYDVPAMTEDISGYSKTINGISSYANVNGVAKANITNINGI